jgi:hypothetical protein
MIKKEANVQNLIFMSAALALSPNIHPALPSLENLKEG